MSGWQENDQKGSNNGHLGPFGVIFWHLHRYLSQKVDSDGHYEGLNMSDS